MDISYYLTYDLPVPYKKLKIYPITVKDYLFFNGYSQCFFLDKNSELNGRYIAMSDLKYIYVATLENPGGKPYLFWLDRLFSLCLKEDSSFSDISESILRYKFDSNEDAKIVIDKEDYDNRDYKEIRSIIAEQNVLELPDFSISKEVRDSLEEAKRYKEKLSENKPASLEDYIISVASVTGWTFEYIYSMTIRKFTKAVSRIDNLIHYKIYLSSSLSGFVEFKDKSFIKHWLSNLDTEGRYSDVSVNLEDVQGKVSLESAMK